MLATYTHYVCKADYVALTYPITDQTRNLSEQGS